MTDYINQNFWRESLTKPDWYNLLLDDFKRLEKLAENEKDYDKRKAIKHDAFQSMVNAINENRLPIAQTGDDLDFERKTIDTIVIHHTNNKPGMKLDWLNAMQMILLYGKYYADKPDFRGSVWSGHFLGGKQVFWAYHWFIRQDGLAERILDDKYIGWHAGNWDINTKSIAICIDDDLNDKEPSDTVIKSIAKLIVDNYPNMKTEKIIGHCDVFDTKCPGRLFNESWKRKMINLIESRGNK